MKPTNLLIAAVVLAGLSGLIWWSKKNPEDKSTATPAAPKLLDISDAQLQSVQVDKKGGAALTLTKEKGKWAITAPQSYPADQDAVTSMVSTLSGLNADSVVEDKPGDAAKYGLQDPSLSVIAHEKNGKTEDLQFGDDIPASSNVYARINKDARIYAVPASVKTGFSKDVNELRDKRLLTFDNAKVSRLELLEPKADIEFGRVNENSWQIVKPQPYRADSFQVEDILRKLADAKMDLTGKPDDTKAADVAFKAGRPVADAKITDPSGIQTLDIRQNKDDYYARSSQVPGTFKVASDLGKALDKPVDDFRNKKLFDFGFNDLTRLEVQQGTSDKTYVRSGTDWKMGMATMDAGTVQALIDKLRDLSAASFVTTGFAAPNTTLTVAWNNGKKTEKLELSKVADGYIAKREGEPALYKLDTKPVDDILDSVAKIKPAASAAKK